MIYLGIDPGVSGGIASIRVDGDKVECVGHKMPETLQELAEFFEALAGLDIRATLEYVWPRPFDKNPTSIAKLVLMRGHIEMALMLCCIPFRTVMPAVWQKAMGCQSKGDKKVTRDAAQKLFPNAKLTHATADAALIAEYGRRFTWRM